METPVEKLAFEFSKQLKHEISLFNLDIVNARNSKEGNSAICHSHDYCDANEAMLAAFETTFGRPCVLSGNGSTEQIESDCNLWNVAWSLAKENKFYYSEFVSNQETKY